MRKSANMGDGGSSMASAEPGVGLPFPSEMVSFLLYEKRVRLWSWPRLEHSDCIYERVTAQNSITI